MDLGLDQVILLETTPALAESFVHSSIQPAR